MDSIEKVFRSTTGAITSRFVHCQLAANVLTVIMGFSTFLPLGYIQKYFSNQCMLYADLHVKLEPVDDEMTVKVCLQTSVWGATSLCNFATFAPVVAAIHAFIWCWFFALMKKALKEEKCEYQLLLPSTLCHGIMFIVLLVDSCIVSAGGSTFCRNLQRELNSQFTCSDAFGFNWDIYSEGKKKNIYAFLVIATISIWILTIMILIQCLLAGYKLYQWFLQDMNLNQGRRKRKRGSCG